MQAVAGTLGRARTESDAAARNPLIPGTPTGVISVQKRPVNLLKTGHLIPADKSIYLARRARQNAADPWPGPPLPKPAEPLRIAAQSIPRSQQFVP